MQVELDAAKVTELECEYHSAEYQKLLEVITALWTVSGHIKKVPFVVIYIPIRLDSQPSLL